jgi:hypothetical protein
MKRVYEIYYQLPLSYLPSKAANDLNIEHIMLNYQRGFLLNILQCTFTEAGVTKSMNQLKTTTKTHDQVVSTHALYSGPQFSTQVESQLS